MSSNSRGLYLPPAVLNLPAISWPARLVLAEILDLYKVNGQVWANDQHFVNRLLGTSLRTVQGAIKELVDAGLLIRETNQKALHKRLLTPIDLPQNLHETPADFAGATSDLPQNLREPTAKSAVDLPQNLHEAPADFADINYTLNTKGNKDKEGSSAANASPASSSSITEKSVNKPSTSKKKAAASAAEVAALERPHLGKEFGDLWEGFVASPKQQGKSLLAFRLLLKKLAKYEEGFAVVMLEKAIEGNWSGVEYDSTKEAYAKWQAEQARRPPPPDSAAPLDRDALFGFSQSASDGLAQARNTPEYQAYLAQQQAAQGPATAEEIAALPLPHKGAQFAEAWSHFMRGPKQAEKMLHAYELMLKQLGGYPEAFAVLMLEKAITGNWQAVENDGTYRAFLEWKKRPVEPQPAQPSQQEQPEMNLEFVAMQERREKARRAGHLAWWGARNEGHSEEEADQIRKKAEQEILESGESTD